MKNSTLISSILTIGIKTDLSRKEIKNVSRLNFCSISWIVINVLFIIEDLFVHYPDLTHSLLFITTILFLCLVFFFQKRYYYVAAKILFIVLSVVYYVILAIYLEPGGLLEYLLLFIPIFSLIFFDNYWVSFVVLLLSYILFIYMMLFFGNYNGQKILYTGNLGLFLGVYIAFAYFKVLNTRSEKSLEKKHNQAIIAKEKIEQQRKELEELNKFQSHFLVNLSHEIRTPLTLIKGSSTKLVTEKDVAKLANHYTRIEQNSDKIHLLIDNIMDLAKMKSNKLELNFSSVGIIQFCKKVLNTFEPLFSQKKIKYKVINETETDGITCSLDSIFMERALGNLLLNAYKYTNENGKIEIILKSIENQVFVTVKDTGCGISEEELPHIFDSFYRAKNDINNSGGTGVGLSFTKEVIDLHNGQITAKSIIGKGSEFIIMIPISEINLGSLDEKEKPSHSISIVEHIDKDARILLIEDNIEMRAYIKETLSRYHVIEAADGNEALTILSNSYPDLIITDYMMPGMNGYEFVQHIRKQGLDIPVIVITARVDKEAKIDFLRLGLDDYLNKPFNEEELLLRAMHSLKNNKERIQFNDSNEGDSVEPKELNKLRKIIEINIKSTMFGVKELADVLSVSERTLQRKIKLLCGLSPNDFIREIRLQKAMEYYEHKNLNSTKELAKEIGYTNSGHLAVLFEKRFGKKLDFRSRL